MVLASETDRQVLKRKKWSKCYEGILEAEYEVLKAVGKSIKEEIRTT